ncbi:hypothetical protein TON_0708 [Thermococcus onnurineus NA1]|uniref:Uncharacterized protein n=1 Tax=Thermococcus onnurineus (strain NA1) TaxID=523850 RepID=B6YVB8_THEON|nr:hypothetical protein [Thermococcus onnurineus]ACJ16196.1 hypothetical protein TON_0708 [Thermococcus onnurineus NA1]
MEPRVYEVPVERVREVFGRIEEYDLLSVDVENEASVIDDMLGSEEGKLRYVREKLDDGNIDSAVLVVRDGTGTLVVKMENVITIRATVRNYERLIEEFGLKER